MALRFALRVGLGERVMYTLRAKHGDRRICHLTAASVFIVPITREKIADIRVPEIGQRERRPWLAVNIGIERVIDDKFAARFDHVAHKLCKQFIRSVFGFDADLQKRARI